MPSAAVANGGQRYACKCLNIRICPLSTDEVAADLIADADFTPIFVGEEGITVAHPQVTMRTRTRGTPINGTSRCSRYTTITCLICGLLTYRVHQTYPADVGGKDGPLLPTEDWVERDILKSSNGWIEIHNQCLTGNTLVEAESSSDYSGVFSLLLPVTQALPPAIEPIFERPPSPSSTPASSPPPPVTYLSNLRPLFLPPPYTPSHPIFAYLASLANEESLIRRAAAERSIVDLIQAKVTEIEKADTELRRNVEILWQKFRESVGQIQHDRASFPKASVSKPLERLTTNGSGTSSSGTPIAIRDFVPGVVSPSRSSPPRASSISGLSASLATTSFHGPRGRGQTSPTSDRSRSTGSTLSNTPSNSDSSTLVLPLPSDGSNILKYKRNINDTINTAASFRYFVNLEEDMERHKRNREKEVNGDPRGIDRSQESGPSRQIRSPSANDGGKQISTEGEQPALSTPTQQGEPSPSRGRETTPKGKKKVVTFDVKPEIVTIKREVNSENDDEEALGLQDQRDMVFVIDGLDEEDGENSPSSKPTLPLVEPPAQPQRPKKPRAQNLSGLSASFSGLRPSSLPAPSHIRPPRGQHGSDVSTPPSLARIPPRPRTSISPIDLPVPAEAQDEAILRLVAANTPSHRGAWAPDTKAWQTFVRRKDSKGHTGNEDIPEEEAVLGLDFGGVDTTRPIKSWSYYDGDDDSSVISPDFVGSLPIPIKSTRRPAPALSVASYQPEANVSERPQSLPPLAPKGASSAAIRKAAYAERDRSRSMDPGALDFAAEEDEQDEEDDNFPEDSSRPDVMGAGDRGRQRALKILQKRSEIPEAGMWRSLAS